ncbi:MAG: DUF5107 domain-containing protein [Flavitalea sp.]
MQQVKAWVETVVIPTYETAPPEKNPIFLEKRVYQGSRGAVYPHPVIEKIAEEKTDKEYRAVFIENDYLRIMILPSLGGRIQRAYDKIRNRDFVYYNQVIKPALVGLTGPWISGGIEFNWPQHHRPSTFDAIDFNIEENKDGSKTIWVNEVELMTRTKGMAGFTLYPDKAYLEIKGRLFNRTSFPQTFLWWANPAVKVNEHYQSVFPPDVHAVFDHGKRDVISFPVAKGTYYKVDYSPGTDISRYKNIPVPTSFMAVESEYNFIGGYEHDTQAGMLHVANHHISPGKKQWTWGSGDFGQAWDRNLTDEDGPYIELMCGVFTDNQPDFSWLYPNEEKTFEQYFMPYAGIGEVKNATKNAAINCVVNTDAIEIRLYSTGKYPDAVLEISTSDNSVFSVKVPLEPGTVYENRFVMERSVAGREFKVELSSGGKLIVDYHHRKPQLKEIPSAAIAAPDPVDVPTIEQLFLHGLHLEQYRHATYDPRDYYQEALWRDKTDIRCNNALGVWYLRRAQPAKAEPYLQMAVKSLLLRNPNPYDGEPLYNLGICLKTMGRYDEAFSRLYKSVWNDAWQHSGYLQLARIACMRKEYEEALDLINKSLNRNYSSPLGRHLKTAILRKLGFNEQAKQFAETSLEADAFNLGCAFELTILNAQPVLKVPVNNHFNSYAEYSIDYAAAGLYDEAFNLLSMYDHSVPAPLFNYYQGYFRLKDGDLPGATEFFKKAKADSPAFCFPSKTEEVEILSAALEVDADDAKALYYLGNYWFANNNFDEAISCWERSVELDDQFPTSQRNLALAYYNKQKNTTAALQLMKNAFELDETDARLLMELDLLYKLCNYPAWDRLKLLEAHDELVEQRNDLYMERLTLYNQLGDFETAKALIASRNFQPWEGGEGKIVLQYCTSHIELAKQALENNDPVAAIALLDALDQYPSNLGEGKLPGKPENDLFYWKAIAYRMMKSEAEANKAFEEAKKGDTTPHQAIFYNDPQPENIFYNAKAQEATGNKAFADELFNNLVRFGESHLDDKIRIDYFAVSLPELMVFDQDLDRKNRIHCLYVMGLGYLGLGDKARADDCFAKVLSHDVNHIGAIIHTNCSML